MKRSRLAIALLVLLVAGGSAADAQARWWCRGAFVPAGFAYGNVGYAAGYSVAATRWGWGGWCGPRWGWGYRPCGFVRPFCNPWYAPTFSIGCPPYGVGGWYGATTFGCADSVYLATPAWGGASFFSGSIVPFPYLGAWGYPTTWLPGCYASPGGVICTPYGTPLPGGSGFGPVFGPAGVLPFLGVTASTMGSAGAVASPAVVAARSVPAARPVIAAAARSGGGPAVVIRASGGLARLRAARMVAVGDRHLRAAQADPARLQLALDAYRRAAATAQDQPDTYVRQAIALVALGRRELADAALDRAVAVDGRLGTRAAAPANLPADPVFDGRPAGGPDLLAQRGAAILREIGTQSGDDAVADRAVAWLADRWSDRWQAAANVLAANGAVAR